ncbi:MAG: acyl carrier protein [Lachnospiraceae bacterium]|jgi:acyl carrier protein
MEFEKLQQIIAEVLNIEVEKITTETKFIDDLGADSLDVFQIILAIEEMFDISISDSQAETIITVGDAVSAIKDAVNE